MKKEKYCVFIPGIARLLNLLIIRFPPLKTTELWMNPGLVLATLPLFPGNLRSFHMSHKIITATLVLKGPMRALQGLKCLDSHHKSQ